MRRILRRASASVLFLAAVSGPAGAQAFSAAPRVDFPINATGGREVQFGDVNGDGKLDMLALSTASSLVSVLVGNGVGGFSPKSDVALAPGAGPVAFTLGDINGDGRLDLAVANASTTISVLLGNGAGGFGARTEVSVGAGTAPHDVKIADMTGDGRPDLVVAVFNLSRIAIFPGNGAGGFGTRRDIVVNPSPEKLEIGDLNGDGLMDVCVLLVSPNYRVGTLIANGSGSYVFSDWPSTGAGLSGIALGDVDADGDLDVVTTNANVINVSVYRNDGSGGLAARTDYGANTGVQRVVIADMNGDGRADVALVGTSPARLDVMLGNGAGALGTAVTTTLGSNPASLAVGDVNGDGRPDIGIGYASGAIASVVFNATGGFFQARTDRTVGTTPRGVTTGDLNGDGRPDLVVANSGSNTISVMLGTAAGAFGPKTDFNTFAAPVGLAIGDVDGDGRADLVVANSGSGTVSLMHGNGQGGFSDSQTLTTGAGPVQPVFGDFNVDGRLDLAVVNNIDNTLSVFFNNQGVLQLQFNYTTSLNPASAAVGDMNADGFPDLVVSNGSSNSVRVYQNIDGDHFGAGVTWTTGSIPLGVAVGDVDADGDLDIVVANGGANTVSLLIGIGNLIAFQNKVDYPVGFAPEAVALGDVNGDGRLDLCVANSGNAAISVLLGTGINGNSGVGVFTAASDVPVADGARAMAMGDLNGDGRLDLAAATQAAKVSVVLGLVPTTTTLSVPPSPIVAGSPVVLSANVTVPAPGFGTPADSVRFFDGHTLLGTSPVVGGQAGLALFAPYRGDRAICAVYKGDGKLFGSFSNVVAPRIVATAAAAITGIADIAGDQGGQARLTFTRSAYDYSGSGTPITGYQVYRRAIIAGAIASPLAADPNAVQLAGWDYLLTVPATGEDVYQSVVSTLADSNGTGVHRAVLFVRAATATPTVFYDSPADSGHSVDNLAPAMPAPLTAAYVAGATRLHWLPNGENDLASYRVYKGASAGFVPGPGNLIASPPDTGYADAGAPGSFYKVSAVDVNGNQSTFALVGPDATTDVVPDGLAAFALERVRPNPAPASRLMVSFSLPVSAPARLEMFDVRGRRVAVQEVGGQAGRNSVRLTSVRLAAGMYMLKLTQGSDSRTQRVTVVD